MNTQVATSSVSISSLSSSALTAHLPYASDGDAKASSANEANDAIDVLHGPSGVAFSPDGKHAYVANEGADAVSVIVVATGIVSQTIKVGALPHDVRLSSDGRVACVTNQGSDT